LLDEFCICFLQSDLPPTWDALHRSELSATSWRRVFRPR
jgi:hypothetical protein